MIKLKQLLMEEESAVQAKLDSIPEKLKLKLGKRIYQWSSDRSDLHQGHSGHKWTGLLIRHDNIEKQLVLLGFNNTIKNEFGDTEVDLVWKYLFKYFLLNQEKGNDSYLKERLTKRDFDGEISKLEKEWERLDSMGGQEQKQLNISIEIEKLVKEKEKWYKLYKKAL